MLNFTGILGPPAGHPAGAEILLGGQVFPNGRSDQQAHCWHPGSQVICQADKEDKAWGLANYVCILYRNSEEWIRKKWGVLLRGEEDGGHLKWSNGSELIAVPSGESQIRYYHPTVYIMDEAAKLPEAEQCYGAANPVSQQIIAVSSASPSWFGDQCEVPAG